MQKVDYLIVGGGIAGTTAAETIRSKDPESSITILTEENDRLYSRVLLPHYLRDENSFEAVYLRTPESYLDKKITLETAVRVVKIDLATRQVTTQDNQIWGFGKLLIASGGKVNKLDLPGASLPQIVYLRTLDDAKKVKELIGTSKKAVVIGGGFIGIELAQSFLKAGLETTAIIREDYFWQSVVGENSGKILSKILEENGVKILPQADVLEFIGQDQLEGVKLKDGQVIPADLAGVGIGIHLDLDYLKETNLALKNGVVTNEYLEASEKDVWAAGDAADFYDPIFKRYHHLGNWSNASAQGRVVGANMVGSKEAFVTASLYSINIFNHNFSFLGDTHKDEHIEVIERGSVESGSLAQLFLRDDTLVGATVINLPAERNTLGELIKNQVKITVGKEKLTDLQFDLRGLLTQEQKPASH